MIGELSIYGVYLPAMALPLLLAYLACAVLRWLLSRTGFYRWIWHRSLFNFSLYLVVLFGMVQWSAGWPT